MNGKIITRRAFMGTAVAVASATTLPGLAATRSNAAELVTLRIGLGGGTFGDAIRTAYFDPYQAINKGISIIADPPDDPARVKAMVEVGNVTADLWLSGEFFGLDTDGDWLEEIDYDRLDASGLAPEHRQKYRVCNLIQNTLITYRTDHYKDDKPENFADFFDTKRFPGKRGVWKNIAGGVFEAALLADGVAPAEMYPIDVDRALVKLNTIKSDLIWWDNGAQARQLFQSGEASMTLVWGSQAVPGMETAPVDVVWGQWLSAAGWWTIPKGAPNLDEAYKALSFFLSKEPQIAVTDYLPYGPANLEAAKSPEEKYKGRLPTDHMETRFQVNNAWWIANRDSIDVRFQEWLLT